MVTERTKENDWRMPCHSTVKLLFCLNELGKPFGERRFGLSSQSPNYFHNVSSFDILPPTQMLTKVRFVTHVIFGIFFGLVYQSVGNDASSVLNNAGLLYFSLIFIVFTSIMPTVVTCKLKVLYNNNRQKTHNQNNNDNIS